MNHLMRNLMLGGSAAGLLAASFGITAAYAQGAAAADAAPVEQVVVSGTRIQLQGYQAPTPVTVIGAEQLTRDVQPDIGNTIRELPAVGDSPSPQKTGGARQHPHTHRGAPP